MKKTTYDDIEKKKFNINFLIVTVSILAVLISGFLYASTLHNPDTSDLATEFTSSDMR